MKFRTIETSLSFDPVIRDWPTKETAIAHCVKTLVEGDCWPADAARDAVIRQTQALVWDDGDAHTIRYESYSS